MKLLRGRIAVVTGAGSGVGRAMSYTLAAQGATLCLVGRTLANLEATASGINQPKVSTRCYPTDLTQDGAVRALAEQLRDDWGAIDILVHSAGVHFMGNLEVAPVTEWDVLHSTNVRAPYLLTQLLLPVLRRQDGQVVFINSSDGLSARGKVGPYSATKHALKALADSFRDEVNTEGIRVMSVYLGRTASPMQARIHAAEGKPYHPESLLQPSDVAAMVLSALCLPRTAEVTDLSIRPLRKPPQSAEPQASSTPHQRRPRRLRRIELREAH